jgi:RNA polymerase sigma-70 factor (ECF subfamily)
MTDEALILAVTRAQRGDTRAFDALVRQFQNPAVAYARTLLPDPAAAEDAAQEAFVQAWRDLPRLTEAAAFGAWLRRLVFKFCDRVRRSARPTLPLAESLPIPGDQEPGWVVERADEAARVRAAIEALPGPLREATLLYYLTGHDIKEIAAFLALPPSTVKNRLHAARKRLRKELWTMAETILETEKPSQSEAFAENVLARVLREFQQQEAADPQTVNRGLLEEGRTALFQRLGQDAPLDDQTVRDGFTLLWRKWDFPALSGLLMRYLSQPLPDSETAWAYVHLANAVAMSGSAAGAVLAHEAFERWLPGKSPYLSAHWPYYPVSEDTPDAVYAGDEVRLLFLAQSGEFSTSYLGVWRNNDYLAKVDAVLAEIPITPGNRWRRFFVLRMASNACESAGDLDRAHHYIQQMHVLAAEAENETLKADLQVKAVGHEIIHARCQKDEAVFITHVEEMTALLNAAEQKELDHVGWIRSERHNLACELVNGYQYELALPLWESVAQTGRQIGGWGWLMYAATVWQLTRDRPRTLALLREARADDDRDMVPLFAERPEFASVRDDPEFREAIGRK